MDHTLVTHDGKGTFHGMGITECSIFNEPVPDKRIKRNAKIMTLYFYCEKVHQTSMVSAARNSCSCKNYLNTNKGSEKQSSIEEY